MAFHHADVSPSDHRTEVRDAVHHRAQAIELPGGVALGLLIVNLSRGGLMARTDVDLASGARLRLTLPHVGIRTAEVRWALGGRVGCRFDQPIAAAAYPAALAAIR